MAGVSFRVDTPSRSGTRPILASRPTRLGVVATEAVGNEGWRRLIVAIRATYLGQEGGLWALIAGATAGPHRLASDGEASP